MSLSRSIITQGMSRRDFLGRASAAAFSSCALLESAWAQAPKFVIAETSFGKIRGIDSGNIKIFKEFLMARTPKESIGSCPR